MSVRSPSCPSGWTQSAILAQRRAECHHRIRDVFTALRQIEQALHQVARTSQQCDTMITAAQQQSPRQTPQQHKHSVTQCDKLLLSPSNYSGSKGTNDYFHCNEFIALTLPSSNIPIVYFYPFFYAFHDKYKIRL